MTQAKIPIKPRRGSDVLAFTCTYGDRLTISDTLSRMRATAGMWFDWVVYAGSPSTEMRKLLTASLADKGIQYLRFWDENRGQHYATKYAFELAKMNGYKWLCRIDGDVTPKTKNWLKSLVQYTEELKEAVNDPESRIVSGPKLLGLKHPIQPTRFLNCGQEFKAEVVPILGGGVRLHNVSFFADYKPDLSAPLGRRDPESVSDYLAEKKGFFVRFPQIRVNHHTKILEARDTHEQSAARRMGMYWPFLLPVEEEADAARQD